jgi:hypothetical protein
MVYKSLPAAKRDSRSSATGPLFALAIGMLRRFARLFVIKTRLEACLVIYALAVGAVGRGLHYLDLYGRGAFGWTLFLACTSAVFMAGAKLLEMTRADTQQRRRKSDMAGQF